MDASSTRDRKRNGTACMHCRQMKLKCDAKQRFPWPCSRCEKNNKSCAIDPTFRRTARRNRLSTLENELRRLKEGASEPKSLSSTDDGDRARSLLDGSASPADFPQDQAQTVENEVLPTTDALLAELRSEGRFCEAQTLETVTISPSLICDLFLEFYRHYHPRFPLLSDLRSTIRDCNTCPLLFWAIIAIASGRSQTHLDLYVDLAGPVRRLAGAEMVALTSPSLSLVQALLTLCCWPLPFKTMKTDPSWLFCGSATTMALHLGIHRPDRLNEFPPFKKQSKEHSLMCSKTWIACFIINQSLSGQLGIPSTIKLDYSIIRTLQTKHKSLSDPLSDLLQITYKSFSFSETLGNYVGRADGLLPDPIPLIESMEADLNILESGNWDSWSLTTKVYFLSQKLHLFSYSLTSHHSSSWSSLSASSPHHKATYFVSQSYCTAIQLINIWCSSVSSVPLDSNIPSQPTGIGRAWTIFERNALVYAVMLLLHLSEMAYVDGNGPRNTAMTTENAVRSVLVYLKPISVKMGDIYWHISQIIEFICAHENQMRENALRSSPAPLLSQFQAFPDIRSRMSSNLAYTVAHRARVIRAKLRSETESNVQHVNDKTNCAPLNPNTPVDDVIYQGSSFWDHSLFSLWNSLDIDITDLSDINMDLSGI